MTLEPDAPTRGSEVPAGWSRRRVQVLVAAAAVLLIAATHGRGLWTIPTP